MKKTSNNDTSNSVAENDNTKILEWDLTIRSKGRLSWTWLKRWLAAVIGKDYDK